MDNDAAESYAPTTPPTVPVFALDENSVVRT